MKHKPTYLEWLLNLPQVVRRKSMSELVAEVHPLNSLGENRRRKTHSNADKLKLQRSIFNAREFYTFFQRHGCNYYACRP